MYPWSYDESLWQACIHFRCFLSLAVHIHQLQGSDCLTENICHFHRHKMWTYVSLLSWLQILSEYPRADALISVSMYQQQLLPAKMRDNNIHFALSQAFREIQRTEWDLLIQIPRSSDRQRKVSALCSNSRPCKHLTDCIFHFPLLIFSFLIYPSVQARELSYDD